MPTYTSFAKATLGVELKKIKKNHLTKFFSEEQEENLSLEFKSFPFGSDFNKQFNTTVLEVICSFLNSAGGLLIWGAPIESEASYDKKIKVCQGNLTPLSQYLDRSSIINKINDKIQSMPQGIDVEIVEIGKGEYIYIFEVQESPNKPHQVSGTYYMRSGTRTDKAPHYLVYALCRQIQIPQITCKVLVDEAKIMNTEGQILRWEIYLIFEFVNTTENINDHDIYLRVEPEANGDILDKEDRSYVKRWIRNSIFPILSFGYNREAKLKLRFPVGQNEYYFSIWFGGKHSNAKKKRFQIIVYESSTPVIIRHLGAPREVQLIEVEA